MFFKICKKAVNSFEPGETPSNSASHEADILNITKHGKITTQINLLELTEPQQNLIFRQYCMAGSLL